MKLPILGASDVDIDVEAELKKFEQEQMAALGLEAGKEHWRDDNPNTFTGEQRAHTTVLISRPDDGARPVPAGRAARPRLQGQGDRRARTTPRSRFGKEFGNRGQCNPTYFTVGNLVKYLTWLRDEQKIPVKDIVENHVFLTAGACGPCRFGTYVTEYRKALRDSGFEGFRVHAVPAAGRPQAGHRRRAGARR